MEETQNLLLSTNADEETGSDSDLFTSPQHNHKTPTTITEDTPTLPTSGATSALPRDFKTRGQLRHLSDTEGDHKKPDDVMPIQYAPRPDMDDLRFNGINKGDGIAFIDESPH